MRFFWSTRGLGALIAVFCVILPLQGQASPPLPARKPAFGLSVLQAPFNDSAYVPGIDAYGQPVVPADLPPAAPVVPPRDDACLLPLVGVTPDLGDGLAVDDLDIWLRLPESAACGEGAKAPR